MRYFDFHTHAFPDGLAERAVSGLAETSGIAPATDGTLTLVNETYWYRRCNGWTASSKRWPKTA